MIASLKRPFTTVVLAVSADGKIADISRKAARFGSAADKAHLEKQIAQADAALFGAGTLRAYGTTLQVRQPQLLEQRQQQGKPLQPVHIVCSRSAELDPQYPFFRQPVSRWLLTTTKGATSWQQTEKFDRVLVADTGTAEIDWLEAFQQFYILGLKRLAILGGGELVASLLLAELVDEFWLTVCPLVLGGRQAPTPVEGAGFLEVVAPRLQLLEARPVENEMFLHYRVLNRAECRSET